MRVYELTSVFTLLLFFFIRGSLAEQCGGQAEGRLCPDGLCCSEWGWCGSAEPFCRDGCQSQCDGPDPPSPGELEEIIPKETFEEMLEHRNDFVCPAKGFYTYEAFIEAAKDFPNFGTTGDTETRKREIAAFFAQTSQQTYGEPLFTLDPYAWGYCFVVKEPWPRNTYCQPSYQSPCFPGQKYYGRGPMQLQWNYNYGLCEFDIRENLLAEPDLVEKNPVISFKTAIWAWMTAEFIKPSCHDVITGKFSPTPDDIEAGRLPGFGLTTNIINGKVECGIPTGISVRNRIGFYKRYTDLLGVKIKPYEMLYCDKMRPYEEENLNMVVDTM